MNSNYYSQQQSDISSQIKFPIYPSNPGSYKLIESIDILINGYYSADMITLEDEQHFIQQQQYLKRFYGLNQFSTKIQLLSEYYKFHQQFPRIFIDDVYKMMNINVQQKRTLQYQHVKRKMKQGQAHQQPPLTTRRTIQPQQRLLADIQVSYDDFQKKDKKNHTNNKCQQSKQKQLKRVISVHCKEGNGFKKQCKQGLFMNHKMASTNNNNKLGATHNQPFNIKNQNEIHKKINILLKNHNQNHNQYPYQQNNHKKQVNYYKQSMKVKKDSKRQIHTNDFKNTHNLKNKSNALNSNTSSNKNTMIKSANVSSASSLSRSKSKSNLLYLQQLKNFHNVRGSHDLGSNANYNINKHQQGVEQNKKPQKSQKFKEKTKSSKNLKGFQVTSSKYTQSNLKKVNKSESCQALKPKSSLGSNILISNQHQKVKKPSITIENGQNYMRALQKPINNMFNKVILARKR